MCMCMYTCTCMSCIYSMSWIHRYMYKSIRSPSRHHLARCHRWRWQYQRLEIFVWESRGNWGSWTSWEVFVHFENHSLVHQIVRHSSDPCEKNWVCCLGGKKSWFRNKGSWPVPPRGDTTGMGRERELRERDGSHQRSRNYSWELRKRSPLPNCTPWYTWVKSEGGGWLVIGDDYLRRGDWHNCLY